MFKKIIRFLPAKFIEFLIFRRKMEFGVTKVAKNLFEKI